MADDAFGLSEFAKAISDVVRSRIAQHGYAIGIEGPWGSGKSTLLNFVDEILRSEEASHQQVIRFEPWLIGKKEALLSAFFSQLVRAIGDLRSALESSNGLPPETKSVFESVTLRIARYSKYFDTAADGTALLAAFDPSGHGKLSAAIVKFLAWVARRFVKPPPSLEETKEQVSKDLGTIAYYVPAARITILIDDSDRLDPEEAVEILRLIRAVANFPLLTYLVCFDRHILGCQVHQALKVEGESYLEKIFQQIVPMPPQEPFALRRFVRRQLGDAFPAEMKLPDLGEFKLEERQNIIFDRWLGQFLRTPRDAIRLCEGIKFGWPYMKAKKVDFLDYVWLQLIKLSCRPLYDWTQRYVASLGSYRDGGRPGDEEPAGEAAKLKAILEPLGWSAAPFRSGIDEILPGLKKFAVEGAREGVFNFDPAGELNDFEHGRRLGSPSHWRFYFAFSRPSYAIDDGELGAFLQTAAADWQGAAAFLRELLDREHSTKGYYIDVLLDRLKTAPSPLTDVQQLGMARAFADMMDEVPRPKGVRYEDDAWRAATRLLGKAVGPQFADIAGNGKSINWLAIVLRDQGWALGVANPDRTEPSRQWLTQQGFDQARTVILHRFREMGLPAIFELPEPAQIMWCWYQLGDPDELKRLIMEATETDDMFVRCLIAMRHWVSSSHDGVYMALDRQTVTTMMDEISVKERLERILTDVKTSAEIRKSVQSLLSHWEDS